MRMYSMETSQHLNFHSMDVGLCIMHINAMLTLYIVLDPTTNAQQSHAQ